MSPAEVSIQPEDASFRGGSLRWSLLPIPGSILLATAHLWEGGWTAIPIGVGGGILVLYVVQSERRLKALQSKQAELQRKQAERERKARIETTLNTAREFLAITGAAVRANVMLPIDAEGRVVRGGRGSKALTIKYHTTGYWDSERTHRWEIPEGCVGQAWEQKTIVLGGDRDAIRDVSRRRIPNLELVSPLQKLTEMKEKIETVLSVPVKDSDDFGLGVLSFDDEAHADTSKLGEAETIRAAGELASKIGRVLEQTKGWEG